MYLLLLGLAIWFSMHLLPSAGKAVRRKIIVKTGLIPYQVIFASTIILSVVLMVLGWRSTLPEYVYLPPSWGRSVTLLLVLLAFILFVAAQMKTNVKRILRHPQLTGLLLWCVGHLLANGDSRSVILFGGLMLWGIVEIIFINRRDGTWEKPAAVSIKYDVIVVVAGVVLYGILLLAHPYLSGIPLLPTR